MAIVLAAMAALALVHVAPAHASGLRPGVRSAAPSSRALSGALERTAGLSPSQVTAKNVCSAARPGYARCAAQTLVVRSNHALVRPHVRRQATFGRVKPASFLPGFVQPATAPAAAAPNPGTPAYLQQAYDVSYLSQNRGFGDTIAVVDPFDDPTAESDLAVYRSQYGLPPCTTGNQCFTKLNQSGNASPLPAQSPVWEQEMSLDLDAVSALCPKCNILLVRLRRPVQLTWPRPCRRPHRRARTRSRRAGRSPSPTASCPARTCSPTSRRSRRPATPAISAPT